MNRGSFTLDMTQPAVDALYSAGGVIIQPDDIGTPLGDPVHVWTTYDTVILIHAIALIAGWLVLSPLAIFLARFGRHRLPSWFRLHRAVRRDLSTIM